MSELQPLPDMARRGRRRPGGRRAAGADPRRRAARPRPGPVSDAHAAAAARAGSRASPRCSGAGEPVDLAWRRFLRGHGPSVLVIDATGLDVRARGAAAVLDGAPWLLAEGVLIAAGLRDSRTVELRLPAELTGHEAAFLNAVDAIRSLAQVATPAHAAGGAARQPAEPGGEKGRPATGHGWSTRRRPGAGSPCCSPARRASMRRC